MKNEKAVTYYKNIEGQMLQIKELLKNPKDILKSVELLIADNDKLNKSLEGFFKEKSIQIKNEIKQQIISNNGINSAFCKISIPDLSLLRDIAFQLKVETENLFLVMGTEIEGKAHVAVFISDNLVKEKNLHAGNIIKDISKEINGGGGGQPFFATAGGTKPEGILNAFESAKKYNVKIIPFWTGRAYMAFANKERLKSLICRWRNEPALLAWMPEDEPEIKQVKPEEIKEAIEFIKELDPYHPVYINYTQMGPAMRYAGLPGDIMSLDYYLTAVEGRTVRDILNYVDVMEDVAIPMHIPTWNFIVGSNLDNHSREISAEEQVAQTYGNIVSGATGLGYFFGQLAGKKHWQAFKNLDREIKELEPLIFSPEKTAQIKCGSPSVLTMTRKCKDAVYLIAVNVENTAVDVPFDLSSLSLKDGAEASLLFEDRKIKAEGKVLKDKFAPFERHVYKITVLK